MYTAREIIACALRERTLQPFLDAGITRARVNDILGKTIFTTEDLNAYGTLLDYWDRHGKVMTIEQFEKSFPAVSYDLPESDYTPAELIEDFAEGYRRLAAQVGVMDLSEMVDKGMVTDIPAYLEVFKTQLAGIKGRDAKPYRKVTLAELEDLPQPEPLIEGVLDAGMVTMLSGPFSTGKSFIALDWALSIASGETWMGHEVKQCRVLYVSAEGAHGQSKRVKAWKSEHPKARPDGQLRDDHQPGPVWRARAPGGAPGGRQGCRRHHHRHRGPVLHRSGGELDQGHGIVRPRAVQAAGRSLRVRHDDDHRPPHRPRQEPCARGLGPSGWR